ncbi:TRAF-like [Sesbania bispinosa]|nr:TRAF-like [Sesbania bispinosa]
MHENREGRKAPPSQYTFKIESFSWLSKASVEKCASEEFEAGGYKWSLSIFPTGNTKGGGQGHVSIYLVLMDTSSLPVDWEVNAIVNFSVYNFLDDEYVITQEKYESESFVGGDYGWKLLLYPNGVVEGKGNNISLFLVLEVSTLPPDTKLVVDCTLRAIDQIRGQHAQRKCEVMFTLD